MREFLNAILAFISSESLTDAEFLACKSQLPIFDQSTYDDLSRVLLGRDNITDSQTRLLAVYKAKGVNIEPIDTAKTNILLGFPL